MTTLERSRPAAVQWLTDTSALRACVLCDYGRDLASAPDEHGAASDCRRTGRAARAGRAGPKRST